MSQIPPGRRKYSVTRLRLRQPAERAAPYYEKTATACPRGRHRSRRRRGALPHLGVHGRGRREAGQAHRSGTRAKPLPRLGLRQLSKPSRRGCPCPSPRMVQGAGGETGLCGQGAYPWQLKGTRGVEREETVVRETAH